MAGWGVVTWVGKAAESKMYEEEGPWGWPGFTVDGGLEDGGGGIRSVGVVCAAWGDGAA